MTGAVLSKTEQLDRRVDVDDLVALAIALGVSPNALLLPPLRLRGIPVETELAPRLVPVDASRAWAWATGEKQLPNGETPHSEAEYVAANRPHHFGGGHWRLGQGVAMAYSEAEQRFSTTIREAFGNGLTSTELRSIFEQAIVGALAEQHEQAAAPPPQPVVAAIVTSDLGVLVGQRRDGKPPWTFIAGEQRLDERPEQTAEREVKEEAGGLKVHVGEKIGERVHPKTGRLMTYMAARPTHGTEIVVGDPEELTAVDWVSLAKADELMADMFGPVREHLARELGEAIDGTEGE